MTLTYDYFKYRTTARNLPPRSCQAHHNPRSPSSTSVNIWKKRWKVWWEYCLVQNVKRDGSMHIFHLRNHRLNWKCISMGIGWKYWAVALCIHKSWKTVNWGTRMGGRLVWVRVAEIRRMAGGEERLTLFAFCFLFLCFVFLWMQV